MCGLWEGEDVRKWFRDWWRGYSDADWDNMIEKLASPHLREPGSWVKISEAELRAYQALMRTTR